MFRLRTQIMQIFEFRSTDLNVDATVATLSLTMKCQSAERNQNKDSDYGACSFTHSEANFDREPPAIAAGTGSRWNVDRLFATISTYFLLLWRKIYRESLPAAAGGRFPVDRGPIVCHNCGGKSLDFCCYVGNTTGRKVPSGPWSDCLLQLRGKLITLMLWRKFHSESPPAAAGGRFRWTDCLPQLREEQHQRAIHFPRKCGKQSVHGPPGISTCRCRRKVPGGPLWLRGEIFWDITLSWMLALNRAV